MFTFEDRLGRTVSFASMTTSTASLARITSIDVLYKYVFVFCLILQELLQLVKTPTMYLRSLLLPHLASISNSRQVFQKYCGSCFKRFYNLFGDTMVNVCPEAVLLFRYLLKVSFGRLCIGRLQPASQLHVTVGNSIDMRTSKKTIIRTNSDLFDPSVNPKILSVGSGISYLFGKNDMKEDPSLGETKFSRLPLPSQVFLEVSRDRDIEALPTIKSLDRDLVPVEPSSERLVVIPDRTVLGLRASGYLQKFFGLIRMRLVKFGSSLILGFSLLLQFFPRFERLSGLDSGRDCKVSREIFSCSKVGFVVKRDSVEVLRVISCLADEVVRSCICLNCWFKHTFGLIQFDFDGSS